MDSSSRCFFPAGVSPDVGLGRSLSEVRGGEVWVSSKRRVRDETLCVLPRGGVLSDGT